MQVDMSICTCVQGVCKLLCMGEQASVFEGAFVSALACLCAHPLYPCSYLCENVLRECFQASSFIASLFRPETVSSSTSHPR